MNTKRIAAALALSALVVGTCGVWASASAQGADAEHRAGANQERAANGVIRIPSIMATEHEMLHAELAELAALGGKTGAAARKVEEALAPHFEEENRYALPPLGLLPALAKGGATEDMRPAIELARHVEQNLDRFVEEHRNITNALDGLEAAGRAESKAEALDFAAELRTHAAEEEQVLYPTTILIGRYLEQNLGKQQQ
jgi:hypothetical protein